MKHRRDPRVHLREIDHAAELIAEFIAGTDFDGFLSDPLVRSGVERQFEILGDSLNSLEKESPAVAARIPDLRKAIGFRHHLAHDYRLTRLAVVWKTAVDRLPEHRRVVQSVLAELERDAAATPDPRLADDMLVLTCAVSERVDPAASVHRASLPLDIQEVFSSTALAEHVAETTVDEVASGIARKRAEADLRVAAARAIGEGEIFEVRARFDGTPDYPAQANIDAYEAALAEGMQRLQRETPEPSEIERRVARVVAATRGTRDRHGQELARAMVEALEFGTPATADEIRKERTALLAELQDGPKTVESFRERALLRRIYRSFTAAEVRDLSQGRGPFLESLPDDAARAQAVQSVQRLHRKSWPTEPSPWRLRHRTLARSFGAERGHDREQGRYRGTEIDI